MTSIGSIRVGYTYSANATASSSADNAPAAQTSASSTGALLPASVTAVARAVKQEQAEAAASRRQQGEGAYLAQMRQRMYSQGIESPTSRISLKA